MCGFLVLWGFFVFVFKLVPSPSTEKKGFFFFFLYCFFFLLQNLPGKRCLSPEVPFNNSNRKNKTKICDNSSSCFFLN